MNFTMIFYIVGWILEFTSAFLLLPLIVAGIYREPRAAAAFAATAVLSFLAGFLLKLRKPHSRTLYMREGFVTVAFGWMALSLVGALPFVISGDIPNYINALFESASGFTTTGATILGDIEALSRSGLFWRSFTHWIGGMGVFVFMMTILPLMGGSTMNLMRAESTGPSVDKLVPHARDSAKILYQIYLMLTLFAVAAFRFCGMSVFDAVTTAFGTLGTGGFGVRSDSIAGYSAAAQWAITFFMILSGINYAVYFLLLQKRPRDAFHIEEVRWFLAIVLIATAMISFDLRGEYGRASESIRHAAFQVASIISTTGFSTADFDLWPALSKTILVTLMFLGACSGSTAGGIKISRLIILCKSLRKELSTMVHPRQVQKIRIDARPVAHETVRATNVFLSSYFLTFFASLLLLAINEFDFTTNFTAVVAMLGNVGPGLALVGPTQNFSIFSPFSKIVLILDMLAGRLELFPILILLHPEVWKKY